jgi:hypothetical protein
MLFNERESTMANAIRLAVSVFMALSLSFPIVGLCVAEAQASRPVLVVSGR